MQTLRNLRRKSSTTPETHPETPPSQESHGSSSWKNIPGWRNWAMTSYALNPQDKDVVFSYQCGLRDPMAFGKGDDAGWLKCGDIVDNDRYATRVHKALVDLEIIDPTTGVLDTSKIQGQVLLNKLAFITARKTRKLIDLLFWWELESRRWEGAEAEKQRYTHSAEEAMEHMDPPNRESLIKQGIAVIEKQQREIPSQRRRESALDIDMPESLLAVPNYHVNDPHAPADHEDRAADPNAAQRQDGAVPAGGALQEAGEALPAYQ